MKIRFAIGAATALAAVTSVCQAALADTPFMPDGTYDYALKQGVTTIGTSSLAIKRAGSVIGIHEEQTLTQTQLGLVKVTSDESVIAETLAPLSFVASYLSSGKAIEVRLAMSGGAGAFVIDGQRLSVPVRMLPDTQAMAVQEELLVSSFVVLPALAQAAKANAFTAAAPTAGATFVMRVDPATQTRPSSVAVRDAGLGIASPVAFSVWYDPGTGVVEEVDVPSLSLVISLTKHT